jgi:hypothetical protein
MRSESESDIGAEHNNQLKNLFDEAVISRKNGDIERCLGILNELSEENLSPPFWGRLGNEYNAIDFPDAAFAAFKQQCDSGHTVHIINGSFGIARSRIIADDLTGLNAAIAALPSGWQSAERALRALVLTAVRKRRTEWLVPLLAEFIRGLNGASVPDIVLDSFLRIRDEPTKALLARELMETQGDWSVEQAEIVTWLAGDVPSMRVDAVSCARHLAREAPERLRGRIGEILRDLIPTELQRLQDEDPDIAQRLERLKADREGRVAVLFGRFVQPEEVLTLLDGFETVDLIPDDDVLADRERSAAWSKAIDEANRGRNFDTINLKSDFTSLNSAEAHECSDASDRMSKSIVDGFLKESVPEPISELITEHREPIELQLSDRLFSKIRADAALHFYLEKKNPKLIVVYVSNQSDIDKFSRFFDDINFDCTLLFASGYKKVVTVREVVKRSVTPPSETSSAAVSIDFDMEQWRSTLQLFDAWADATSARIARAVLPPLLVFTATDRVYGPTIKTIKESLCGRFSLFTLFYGAGSGSEAAFDELANWSVDSDTVIEFPTTKAPAHVLSTRISPLAIKTWMADFGIEPHTARLAKLCGLQSLAEVASRFFGGHMAVQIIFHQCIRRLFAHVRPAALIAMPTRLPTIRIAARTARNSGVVVIEAMAVYLSQMPRYRKPVCDHILAIDTTNHDLLINHFGISPEDVTVVGSLRFEPILERLAAEPAEPISSDSRTIMIVTQTRAITENLVLVWHALNVMRKARDLPLKAVIKVHPAEPEHHLYAYERAVRRFQQTQRVEVTRDRDPYRLARSSDLVVSSFSNLALEAAAFDRPVLLLSEDDAPLPVRFDEMGVAVIAKTGPQFLARARDLLEGGPVSRRLADKRRAFFDANPLMREPGSKNAALSAILRIVEGWRPSPKAAGPEADLPTGTSDIFSDASQPATMRWENGALRLTAVAAPARPVQRRLILAEWSASTKTIEWLKQIEDETPAQSHVILCPNPALREELKEVLASRGADANFLPYAAVDSERDDRIFRAVSRFVEPMQAQIEQDAVGGSEDDAVGAYVAEAVTERLIDQLVVPFRFATEALKAVEDQKPDQIVALATGAPHLAQIAPRLLEAVAPGADLLLVADDGSLRPRSALLEAARDAFSARLVRLPPPSGNIIAARAVKAANPLLALAGRDVLMISFASDPTYLDCMLELLSTATAPNEWGFPVVATSVEAQARLNAAVSELGLEPTHAVTATMGSRSSSRASFVLGGDLRRGFFEAQRRAREGDDPALRDIWRYLASHAAGSLLQNSSYFGDVAKNVEELLDQGPPSVLCASPARLSEAKLAFRLAQDRGIPTVDIQTGTFSASRRYRKPIADHVTAIDTAHHRILREYFEVKETQLSTVGSPRIDFRLKPWRERPLEEVRGSLLAELGAEDCKRVFLLATQPIEMEKNTTILRLCLDALLQDMFLLLRPHPVEGPERESIYRSMIEAHDSAGRAILDKKGNIYERICASDFVATYYSTIALEAFCLRRRVVIVDPFDTPPALDFAANGIGSKVRDTPSLSTLLERSGSEPALAPPSRDPRLAVLQDGGSALRIHDIISRMRNFNLGDDCVP